MDFMKEAAIWFLRDYGSYIAMGIVALLGAGILLGSIKSLIGSLFTLAFKAGDDLSKKAASNRGVVVAALCLAAFLWFRPAEKEQRPADAVGQPGNVISADMVYCSTQLPANGATKRSSKADEPLFLVGVAYKFTCPSCGELAALRPNAPSPLQAYTCRCGHHSTLVANQVSTFPAEEAIRAVAGDWLGLNCEKCKVASGGRLDVDLGNEIFLVNCPNCQHSVPVTSPNVYHIGAKERDERRELVTHGVIPPGGFNTGEQADYDEWRNNPGPGLIAPPGGGRTVPPAALRDRWNAYQRSLPAWKKRQFLGEYGDYSTKEPG